MNVINVDNSFVEDQALVVSQPKRRGRPPGSRNSSRSATPMRSTCHAYNLRQRKQNQTFGGFDAAESPDTFGHLIAGVAKKSRENKRKFMKTIKEQKEPKLQILSDNDE